jgi:hypothetical protein
MTTRMLPFKANGHQTRPADGELAKVFEYTDPYPGVFVSNFTSQCGTCDAELKLEITGDAVTVRGDPCAYPDGVTSVITLSVPSGRIIVADDLRPVYNWDDADMSAGYNSALGQLQATEAMAAAGCAYGPVGNSCPGLFRTGGDSYVIASTGYDEETDKELTPEGWELMASVITDLWAYSVADYEDWTSKGGDPTALGWSETVVDVAPGAYRFTHHTGERTFDRDAAGTVIYAHIDKEGQAP